MVRILTASIQIHLPVSRTDRPLPVAGQASGDDAPALRDSPEQQELLEQGLRILARLAVRAYLRRETSLPTADPGEQHLDSSTQD